MADRPNRVGQQLGNYRLIRLLGEGGFAEVYLAEHIYLKTQVAAKVLQEKMEAQSVESFLKEAQMIAALKHPHILRVLDFGMEGTTPFLVMEYALGGTLRQKHPRGSKVLLPTVISYARQVTMALQYAHDQKIVHRDVKPENVLVEADGKIVLGDFGIAIPAHKTQSLSTQEAVGTVSYMAPEQIQGKPRAASDQYSLGIVIYEWLSGARPFEGATAIEIAMHHLTDPPPPLREKLPTIAAEVEQVVMTALAKDPKQRFASVQAFAKALELAVNQPNLSAPTVLATSMAQASPVALATSTSTVQASPVVAVVPQKNAIGTPLLVYRGHNDAPGQTCAWSPDGIRLATGGSNGLVKIWNAVTGQHLLTCQDCCVAPINAVAWSPDGTRLASASDDRTVRVWDTRSGSWLLSYSGHSDTVEAVAWSPDGTRLASASGDKTVQVWDVRSSTLLLSYTGHFGLVEAVAWSPDGTRLASASGDGTVQVWDARSGTLLRSYTGHSRSVNAVAWSPDGSHLASASDDKTVQVWDTLSGTLLRSYTGHSDKMRAVAWSPDGNRLVSASDDHTVQVWDTRSGSLLRSYSGCSYCYPADTDDLSALFLHLLRSYTGHSESVNAVAWSPDGSRLASASDDHTVQVWDARSGSQLLSYTGHSESVRAVVWSPDGSRLASASDDKTVQAWDAQRGTLLHSYTGYSPVAWSPDGSRLASVSGDKTVQVWDARSGSRLCSYVGHSDWVRAVAWSPDSTRLALGADNGVVVVWQAV